MSNASIDRKNLCCLSSIDRRKIGKKVDQLFNKKNVESNFAMLILKLRQISPNKLTNLT